MSHPSRVRGLKFSRRRPDRRPDRVAPFTGAWVEILSRMQGICASSSHPSRVRGLKLRLLWLSRGGCPSHPSRVRGLKCVRRMVIDYFRMSHPSRVRGLKSRAPCSPFPAPGPSHPSRVRGLK